MDSFKEAFATTFTPSNIQGAFRGSGVHPLNAEAVLSKLTLKIRTPSPQLDIAATTWQSKTPHNQQEADRQVAYTIQKIIDRTSSSPESVIEALDRSHKGHQRTATELALMRAELHSVKIEVSKLNRRREITRKRFKSTRPSLTQSELQQSDQPAVASGAGEIPNVVEPPLTYPSGRALPQCGHCKTPGHRSTTCPTLRQTST